MIPHVFKSIWLRDHTPHILIGVPLLFVILSTLLFVEYISQSGELTWSTILFEEGKNHFIALTIGTTAAVCIATMQLHRFFNTWTIVGIGVFAALILLIISGIPNGWIPGIDVPEINGTRRWVSLGGLTLQPSEFVKIVIAVALSFLVSQERRKNIPFDTLFWGAFSLGVLVLSLGVTQSHYGFIMICAPLFLFLLPLRMFWLHRRWIVTGVVSVIVIGSVVAYYTVDHVRYRLQDIFGDDTDTYHKVENIEAIRGGGLSGAGGVYPTDNALIPEQLTDSVFALLVHEFGFLMGAIVLIAFLLLFFVGFQIAYHARTRFDSLLAFGLTLLLAAQASINISFSLVNPFTGEALPFLSNGGSSLLASTVVIGLLYSIHRNTMMRSARLHSSRE